jgi:flavin-dependent dehydrogenase
MSGDPEFQTDVVIIGGGPAGAAAALCLGRAGIRGLIVERDIEPRDRPGESLAPAATPLLQRLGVFAAFLETSPLPCYGNRSCWGGSGEPVEYDFIRDPYGHGWHIDRRSFDQMFVDAARAAGADVLAGASLVRIMHEPMAGYGLPMAHVSDQVSVGARHAVPRQMDGLPLNERVDESFKRGGDGRGARRWQLEIESGSRAIHVGADFVIDASGRAGAFARRLGIHRRHYDRMVAVTGFLSPRGSRCEDSMTLVEAVPEGWWYSAVVPGGRLVTVLMTDPDLLAKLQVWRRCAWQVMLECAPQTYRRVASGCYALDGAPQIAAAGTSLLEPIFGDGWLTAGDAAASYDPLSSHGIGTAISTGIRAAEAARLWLDGDRQALEAYAGRLRAGFARYLPLWRAYYAGETRWPDAPFWARRRSAGLSSDLGVLLAARG